MQYLDNVKYLEQVKLRLAEIQLFIEEVKRAHQM
jgi:hypothetical protein